jgi:hypothetical protein
MARDVLPECRDLPYLSSGFRPTPHSGGLHGQFHGYRLPARMPKGTERFTPLEEKLASLSVSLVHQA